MSPNRALFWATLNAANNCDVHGKIREAMRAGHDAMLFTDEGDGSTFVKTGRLHDLLDATTTIDSGVPGVTIYTDTETTNDTGALVALLKEPLHEGEVRVLFISDKESIGQVWVMDIGPTDPMLVPAGAAAPPWGLS